jgi:hypothetical protein
MPLALPKQLTVEEEERMLDTTVRMDPAVVSAARAWLYDALNQLYEAPIAGAGRSSSSAEGASSASNVNPKVVTSTTRRREFKLNALEVAALRRQPQFIERYFDTFPDDAGTAADEADGAESGPPVEAEEGPVQEAQAAVGALIKTTSNGQRRARDADDYHQQQVPLDLAEVERRARKFHVLTVAYPDIGDC